LKHGLNLIKQIDVVAMQRTYMTPRREEREASHHAGAYCNSEETSDFSEMRGLLDYFTDWTEKEEKKCGRSS
jgi:hypothetical protein